MHEARKGKLVAIDDDFNGAVNQAAQIFNEGGVFVYPTDTIYGIGGDPFDINTVARINSIKGRDESKRFILLIDNLERLLSYVNVVLDKHFDFLHSIWPNPVSVILNLNQDSAKHLGSKTAAFRIPHHRFSRTLISEIKKPIISTSANRSGQEPLLERDFINYELGPELDCIFYSEKKSHKVASTLVDLTGNQPVLIREGIVKFEDLMASYE